MLCLSADCVSQCHLVDSHPARTPLRPAMQKLQRGSPRDVAVSQDILKVQHCQCDKSVCVCVSVSGRGWDGWMDGRTRAVIPRAILSTLMMRMMVGLIGREASSIFSRVMPMMDSSTMTRSSWFHLHKQAHTHKHTLRKPWHWLRYPSVQWLHNLIQATCQSYLFLTSLFL